MLAIRNSSKRFNQLKIDLHNSFAQGRVNAYPTTVEDAFDLLFRYKVSNNPDTTSNNGRRQNNRHNNRRSNDSDDHNTNNTRNYDSHQLSFAQADNKSFETATGTPASDEVCTVRSSINLSQRMYNPHRLSHSILNLIDSATVASVVKERSALTDVKHYREAGLSEPLVLSTNGGPFTCTLVGKVPGLGEAHIWYHPDSIANVFALADITATKRVTMDSAVEKCFKVHRGDGSIVKFSECGEGLYVWRPEVCSKINKSNPHLSFAQTVHDLENLYTPRQVQSAKNVRELQRRLAYPPQQRFEHIIKSGYILNCPYTVDDVRRAYHIYGPIVEALKGKTTRARPAIVPSYALVKLPSYIMNIHQQVTLCIDILLVNGNYFLHTISRNIRFRTTAPLINRSKKQLLRRLKPVFQQYHSRGFEIHEVLADNEFQCLEADILPTRLNLVSRNEHVGDVENSNKYLKQTVRCLLSSTGARRVPKAMVIGAIDLATTCANAFPIDSGISDSLSPSTIVTGRQPLNFNNLKVTFGTFVQIHLHHTPTNTMQPRTINTIALTLLATPKVHITS